MNRHSFEVMGLDENFTLVSLLRYTNLQWNRKFYQPGNFSIQIPLEQYNKRIKYIYTKDRPEVGEISQVNYVENDNGKQFSLSGYFLEDELNRRVAYIKSNTNVIDAPDWVHQSGKAEDVATAYFNAFKDVSFSVDGITENYPLGIATTESQSRGIQSDHYRHGEYLGDKINTILKPSEMSYRIVYDYINNSKRFECWKGVNRTQNNPELNNPIIFSTRYGNLKNPNIVWSDTNYKNAFFSANTYEENNVSYSYMQAATEIAEDDLDVRFLSVESNIIRSDYSSLNNYIAALRNDGHTKLLQAKKTISFDFDAIEGSYEYMVDFDLGDKCSLEVKEAGLSEDAVLTGCNEVVKNGFWTLELEFDV